MHHIYGQWMKIGFEGCSYCSYAKTNDQILFSLFYSTALIKKPLPIILNLNWHIKDVGSEDSLLEFLQSRLVFNRMEWQRWIAGHCRYNKNQDHPMLPMTNLLQFVLNTENPEAFHGSSQSNRAL